MPDGPGIDRDRLVAELNAYLRIHEGSDVAENGLQVEGRREIRKLVTGVSACQALFERAAAVGADAVLVHHGVFWQDTPRALTGVLYQRVATLVRTKLNLLAYHLPLDRHPEVGNNAAAARAFELIELTPFAVHDGLSIGFRGRFAEPVPAAELIARCERIYGQAPLVLGRGPEPVDSVGIVSGGAPKALHQAIAAGLDAFVTGEAAEWVTTVAQEAGIHYLAAGHYATERLGVRALGEHVARTFGLQVEFVDLPNPV